MYEKLEMWIDGEWCQGSDGAGEDVVNPATEEVIGHLPHASSADLDRALDAADRGFKVWRAMSAYDRANIIYKAGALIRERADDIGRTLTLEQGKVLAEGKGEVLVAADIFQWYAEEGRRAYGRIIPSRIPGSRQMVIREPVGPVAAFTPWNFPAVTPARKIAGALGSGCSCIIKASEETPGTTIAMARALADAGLPPGVLNVVFGVPDTISRHLIASPVIRKVTFTGSTPVGKHLTRLAADGMKRTTMELGGHAPVVVFDDVDVDKVAAVAAAGKFRNAGQVCVSPTRFFVHEKVYSAFVQKFTEKAAALQLGNGLDAGSTMGPLANRRRVEAVDGFVTDARDHGARVTTGGERVGNQGYFYAPTVLADVPDSARIMSEEPFGPLAPMQPWSNFDDMIEKANGLPFGLAAYAFTTSTEKATLISDALETGLVGVNHCAISFAETPFGGVKESGYGHEGGIEGLDAYLTSKFVTQLSA
ncbi:MAG: NAD-dependent succinate-semialdehyde dehydrogenase [Ectothiorhodospiraceae bacterium]|nr:NAD-dependent succinate-semialdehyde dehydrogenase [Chromatiales bacterium]MCP5156385.1 NAD-dependent succinate-semialdehyde dehydrogenase [Ectothiorhodospiraceae bacterium]